MHYVLGDDSTQARDLVIQLENLNETLEQRVAKRTAEAVEQAQKLRLLSAQLSLAEEAERRRIAEMLHEDLQQLLVAARMQLAALCRTQDTARREPIAREIADLLERSFQLTRSLSVELAPPVLYEHGLAAALEWLSAETRKNYNIEVTAEADSFSEPESRRCAYFPVQSGARVVAKFGEARWRQRRAHHDAASAARQGPHHRRR